MRDLLNMALAEARGMWRFRWWGLLLAWVVALAGAFYAYSLPDRYRAEARVNIDTQSILQPLLQGMAVQPDLATRVRVITNTLLSRPNVEQIARETDLILDASTPTEQQRLVNNLSSDIRISGGGGRASDVYRISYESSNPRQARDVVQATLDMMQERTLGSSRDDSTSARAFLQTQILEYEQRLRDAEERLAAFKRENAGLLPGQEGDYYQRLTQARDQLTTLEEELSTAESRRDTLRAEVAAMRDGQSPVSVVNPRVQELTQQIREGEQRLNNMLLQYTEAHPDVIALQSMLSSLRAEREQASQAPQLSDNASADLSTNPVYQELQINLNETNAEISALQQRIARQQARIQDLRSRVDQITEVETRLVDLDRTYEITRQQYQQLVSRLNSAELSTEAEQSGGQLQFRVVDPPEVPLRPEGPDRPLYMAAALLFGLGAGGGLTFLLNQIWPVFMDRRRLSQLTGRPVLGNVSLITTPARRRLAAMAAVGFFAVAGSLVAVVGAGVLFADRGSDVFRAWLGSLPV